MVFRRSLRPQAIEYLYSHRPYAFAVFLLILLLFITEPVYVAYTRFEVNSILLTMSAVTQTGFAQLHPFDPLTPSEIKLAVKILESAFPGVQLRYKRIDVQEPLKKDVIPYIEAERLGKTLPPRPARVLYTLFHRLDNGAFYKALLNVDTKSVIYAKELPKHIQVCVSHRDCRNDMWINLLPL